VLGVIDYLPEKQRKIIKNAKYQLGDDDIDDEWEQEDNQDFRKWILEKNTELQRPLTQAELIIKSLEMHGGNLNQSLSFLRVYYYISTRAEGKYRDEESDTYQKRDVTEVARCVLDQFSDFNPFNHLAYDEPNYPGKLREIWQKTIGSGLRSMRSPDGKTYYDFSLNNRIGELYHAIHLADLLDSFPPEALAVFFLGEYLNYGEFQGLCKFLADLRIVSDLHNINDVIRKYTQTILPSEDEKIENGEDEG